MVVLLAILLPAVIARSRRDAALARVDATTEKHIDALVRQRSMQVRNDPYGKPILDKWHAELEYFITQHIRPALKPSQWPLLDMERKAISERISQRVAIAAQQRPGFTDLPASMTPVEFEAFCAEKLRACGWNVSLTSLSHDQGVDVIAEKNGVRVVLQCKLYSNPVGNKAVQEVAAGRVHQQAEYGAVVTNSTFTTSAKQLATTNEIRLLHYTDLTQLEQMLNRALVQ